MAVFYKIVLPRNIDGLIIYTSAASPLRVILFVSRLESASARNPGNIVTRSLTASFFSNMIYVTMDPLQLFKFS